MRIGRSGQKAIFATRSHESCYAVRHATVSCPSGLINTLQSRGACPQLPVALLFTALSCPDESGQTSYSYAAREDYTAPKWPEGLPAELRVQSRPSTRSSGGVFLCTVPLLPPGAAPGSSLNLPTASCPSSKLSCLVPFSSTPPLPLLHHLAFPIWLLSRRPHVIRLSCTAQHWAANCPGGHRD